MIYQLFLNNLHRTPEATAIVTSHGEKFTYAAAHRRINAWANYLIKQGIEDGDRVGVLLDNEDNHFFMFLALDRINASYVPFDTDIPKEQLKIDIAGLDLKKFVIEESLCADFGVDPAITLSLSKEVLTGIDAEESHEPARVYDTEGHKKTSYIVSSSGSTGKKKWIPIMGAGLFYWADVIKNQMGFNEADKILATRSPAYDARIFEYLCALSAGSELHLLSRTQRKDVPSILAVCHVANIRCLLLIASQLGVEQSERIISELKRDGLKHLMVTGDACSPHLKSLCERIELNLWNLYGPTEATFGGSALLVNGKHPLNAEGEEFVPIGKPYGPDVRYHIIGGRLYVESPYLTPGYIGESKDKGFALMIEYEGKKSLVAPLGEAHAGAGSEDAAIVPEGKQIRVFDTGDAFSEEGDFFCYRGRHHFDGHCKINGVKVSPFLIEQCIQEYNHAGSADTVQAAVVIKEHLGKNKPYAYLVIHPGFNKAAFLDYLKGRLKKEEFPIMVCLDELPILLPSQKIDRQQLIKRNDHPDSFLFSDEETPVEETKIIPTIDGVDYQQAVKKIWGELFGRDNLPLDIEFAFLGGDSLMSLDMVRKINEKIDSKYSYLTLLGLKKITITSVAESIIEGKAHSSEQAFIQPLTRIDDGEHKDNIFFLPALLGEGYFSYRHLAKRMATKFDKHIYGLSDPGISNADLLPASMAHAVSRYILAIKSVQPKGPYQLLGFSFGSTLAYEVARQLIADGEKVSELHLVDGFPAHLYQSLSDKVHADLLEALLNFVVDTLNNRFYAEHLKHIKLTNFAKLDKTKQVELGFGYLESKLTNLASRQLLNIAKRHLTFLLTQKDPEEKLALWPTFYVTDTKQQYLDVINRLPALSRKSADYKYFYWTRYFNNITRCGLELEGGHLSPLKAGPPEYGKTAEYYWKRSHDRLFNLKVDHYGPHAFYRLEPVDAAHSRLSIFFLNQVHVRSLMREIREMGLVPEVAYQDKYLEKYEQRDLIYTSQADIFASVPNTKLKLVRTYMTRSGITEKEPGRALSIPESTARSEAASGNIDIEVIWNRGELFTLSFKYNSLPSVVISALHKQLGLDPVDRTDEKATNICYQHRFVLVGANVYQAIESVEQYLADVIAVLQPYIATADSVFCAAPRV